MKFPRWSFRLCLFVLLWRHHIDSFLDTNEKELAIMLPSQKKAITGEEPEQTHVAVNTDLTMDDIDELEK